MVIGHYMRNLWQGGGIASYLRRLSAAQRGEGHDIHFFDLAEAVRPEQRADGVTYCQDDADVVQQALARGVDLLHAHCPLRWRGGALPLFRSVHTHSPYCPSGGRYLKRSDRPCPRRYRLGGCLWGYAVDRCGSLRPSHLLADFAAAKTERHYLPHAHVAAPSAFVRDQMLRQGYDPARVHHLPLPGPPPLATIAPMAPDPARFLFMGRLTPHKGVAWLLESMRHVPPDVQLDIAGDGNERESLEALARQLGLAGRVHFHGWLEGAALDRLLDVARALVFPSRWHEPFGLVSLEAMARGRPVVAAAVGGIPEVVVDGHTGLLVDVDDRAALSGALNRLAGDAGLAARLGRAAHQRLREHYTMEEHLQCLKDLYRRCLSPPPGAGRTLHLALAEEGNS
jgi:glycosyltransferase involved in cell wall biosynthesis